MLLFFLLTLAIGHVICQPCPNDFIQIKSKCYHFSSEKASWNDALFQCLEKNSSLAILRNKHQNDHLQQHMKWYRAGDNVETWIGANYDWRQRVWLWGATGSKLEYNNFAEKNIKDLEWKCIVLDPKVEFKWSARNCFESKHFVCQKNLSKKSPKHPNDSPHIGDVSPGHLKKKRPPKKVLRNLACPKPFIRIQRHCIYFSEEKANWQEAFYKCKESYNSSLAVITALKEDRGLLNNLNRHYMPYVDRWIGGRYDWKQNIWTWEESRKQIAFSPKGKKNMEFHCLSWNPKSKGRPRWDSDGCFKEKQFICQKDLVQVYRVPAKKGRARNKTAE